MYDFSEESDKEEQEIKWTLRKKGCRVRKGKKKDIFGDKTKER